MYTDRFNEPECSRSISSINIYDKTLPIYPKYCAKSKYSTAILLQPASRSLSSSTNHHITSKHMVSAKNNCDNNMSWKTMSLTPKLCMTYDELKPHLSYIGLIAVSILNSKENKLVLSDIYQSILRKYPYFRNRGPGWRNSVRHNLSLNDCFIKSDRSNNGKGHYWTIHPANMDDFRNGDFRRRRAQHRVRKHMGFNSGDESVYNPTSPSEFMINSTGLKTYKQLCAKDIRPYKSVNKTVTSDNDFEFTYHHYSQSKFNIPNRQIYFPGRTVYSIENIVSSYDQNKSAQEKNVSTFTSSDIGNKLRLFCIPQFTYINQPVQVSLNAIVNQKTSENKVENTMPYLQSQVQQMEMQQRTQSQLHTVNVRKRQFDMASLLAPEYCSDILNSDRSTVEIQLYENPSKNLDNEHNDLNISDDDESNKQGYNDYVRFNTYSKQSLRAVELL